MTDARLGSLSLHSRGRRLELSRPAIMGVVNVTPDSFSDGGQFSSSAQAIRYAEALLDQGADLLDVGGMSTRPGSRAISVQEECDRVLPVVEGLRAARPDVWISVDTSRDAVAKEALRSGADIINDVRGLQECPKIADLVCAADAALIVMHSTGASDVMQSRTGYADIVDDIKAALSTSVQIALDAGVKADSLMIDPGFGFGKTWPQNITLLQKLERFHDLSLPVLVGVSRKSFLGWLTEQESAEERDPATHAAGFYAISKGAQMLRVHDVPGAVQCLQVAQALLHGCEPEVPA